jgi:SAM-dependent methyltransferase
VNQSTLSSYAQGHYEAEGGLAPLLDVAVPLLSEPPSGVWLDTGCATGGGCFELVARGADLAVGIDTNIAMLRFARRLVTEGRATYPLRRTGVVYDERTVEVDDVHLDRIELWACSATALPFCDGSLDGALSLNVVDSIDVPVFHLAEMGRVLKKGAEALIACPYDWTTRVTELPRWIGGHSPRSPSEGSPANEMRRLLSDESPPEMNIRLRLVREQESVPWRVYLHERATIEYQTHVMVAR